MLKIYIPRKFKEERTWIINQLFNKQFYDYKVIVEDRIDYLITSSYSINKLIIKDSFFLNLKVSVFEFNFRAITKLESWDIKELSNELVFNNSKLPIIFGEGKFKENNYLEYELDLDIFGSAFFLMSRLEEYFTDKKDIHGRFSSFDSFSYKHKILDRPIVDEYFLILKYIINKYLPSNNQLFPKFNFEVSHDVDFPSMYGFHSLNRIIKISTYDFLKFKFNLKKTLYNLYYFSTNNMSLLQSDPYNTFNWLMDQSELNNIKSTFYFIVDSRDRNFDTFYNINSKSMKDLMKSINRREHDIGIHPSYNSFRDKIYTKYQFNKLIGITNSLKIKQKVWSSRMHFLRWETGITEDVLQFSEIDYDTTMGYADSPGFKAGTCFPYRPYNLISKQTYGFIIKPLINMECTIISKPYLNLGSGEDAFNEFTYYKNICKQVGGNYTLLWHNSRFINEDDKYLYKSILKY